MAFYLRSNFIRVAIKLGLHNRYANNAWLKKIRKCVYIKIYYYFAIFLCNILLHGTKQDSRIQLPRICTAEAFFVDFT